MRSTIARTGERLTSGGLLYRYLAEDGVAGGEATFAICTYWGNFPQGYTHLALIKAALTIEQAETQRR